MSLDGLTYLLAPAATFLATAGYWHARRGLEAAFFAYAGLRMIY